MTRIAGVLIPLFSLRSRADLGRGEIPDLAPMADFARAMGLGAVQLLPLDETAPDERSPYSAMSIFALDPLYIAPGALDGVSPDAIRRARLSLGPRRVVERRRMREVRLGLLRRAYRSFVRRNSPREAVALEQFSARNSYWLADYALFRALKEGFAWRPWEEWPEGLKSRDPVALEGARGEFAGPIAMYTYWQFLAERQWRSARAYAAARGVLLGGDLAFSPARDSAEVWAHQELFDLTRTVGAPPDAFNARGQRWGLPMPNWPRMREQGMGWWRRRARHAAALYGIIRVDHVVGFYRTFNFPAAADAPGGFFPEAEHDQRAQGEEIVRAILEEAGGAIVVAEDLGSVPPWVRASLTALGVPGYKVMQWEKRDWGQPGERFLSPREYPELSLATTGTHDTETLAAWWRDAAEAERRQMAEALGLAAPAAIRPRFNQDTLDAIIEALDASPSRLVVLPFQDLFGWRARINLPGTVRESNWTWRLPLTLERMMESPAVLKRAHRLLEIAHRTGRLVG